MSALAIVLGLAVAGVYGASDFGGGVAAKRVSAIWVLVVSQAAGLALGLVAVGFDPSANPSTAALIRGAVAGMAGIVGLGLLYTALAAGTMGVVAPITAVAAAVVPVAWGIMQGEHPGVAALIGVALAIGAVALAAAPKHAEPQHSKPDSQLPPGAGSITAHAQQARTGIALALAAGLCFGVIFVLLADVGTRDGMWPLVAWRCISIPLALGALLIVRPRPRPDRPVVAVAAAAGTLEVIANGLYILAAREGLLSLVGVLGSLYPISTVLLARVVLHERLGRVQLAGLALALVGIALIAAG